MDRRIMAVAGLAAASLGVSLAATDFPRIPKSRRSYTEGPFPVPECEPTRADFPSRQTFRAAHRRWAQEHSA